ncbi:hypothetical protein [Rufibacter soli]
MILMLCLCAFVALAFLFMKPAVAKARASRPTAARFPMNRTERRAHSRWLGRHVRVLKDGKSFAAVFMVGGKLSIRKISVA